MKNTLILLAMSEILTEKVRKDNKVSRQYYTAEFQDQENPFAPTAKRTIFQAHSADGTTSFWKGGDPSQIKKFLQKPVPAEIVSRQVAPYQIGENTATKYTTVVFGHETVESVFKSAGHDLNEMTTTAAPSVSSEAVAAAEAAVA